MGFTVLENLELDPNVSDTNENRSEFRLILYSSLHTQVVLRLHVLYDGVLGFPPIVTRYERRIITLHVLS